MGQNAPHYQLEKLPPLREKVETIEILRQTNKSSAALAELKGIAKTIHNQEMLINAIVLQEAKDSSEIGFVVNKLGVERKAASRYLKELEDIGIVESQKVGRETLYINRELIEILKQ